MLNTRKEILFTILGGFFVTNAVVGELIGGKLIQLGPFTMSISASGISPVTDEQFRGVFGQSMWIIAGSIIAFLCSQLIDVLIFWLIRGKTGKRMIWLRATGSTVVSQLIDTFIVTGIAFWLPGKLSFTDYINTAFTGYSAKLIIAVALTPLIYAGHAIVHAYLGKEQSELIIRETAKEQVNVRDR
jgi:uncharacterized integral membrane protein (TIGR00697 family)